ncbi:uncharacterized protein [Antedon mediterranea]|uniref:uncharacterized protein n=1 Tax=Antedon mediterranea TaxID=105859 RepID=UPI003AF6F0A3
MKVTAICLVIIVVCVDLTYTCIRQNEEDLNLHRDERQAQNRQRARNRRRNVTRGEDAMTTERTSPAVTIIEIEEISTEDEISTDEAELLIEDITEDGNVTSIDEEDIEDIDIIIDPNNRRRCKVNAITPLDTEQKSTLKKHERKIKVLERNHRVLKKVNAKRPVVKLSKRQRIEVKAYLSGAFMKEDSLPEIRGGAVSNTSDSRRRRDGSYRVCEPVYSWNNVFITIDSNGTLVQVIQLQEDDTYQWFMEETCQSQISRVVNAACDEAERLHLAYVINLTTGNIEQTYVVVYCCVGSSRN